MMIVKLQSDHARQLYKNLNNFKIHRAKTRRVIKTSKKTSWRNYVNKLKSSSKSKKYGT